MFLRRKPKPKKLTLRQVHELYLLIVPSLNNKYLVDEMDEILSRITKEKMEQVLGILEISTENKNG